MSNPTALLVGWKLAGRRVLIVGGGRVAEAKVETLLDTGAQLTVVAPTLTDRLAELRSSGALRWKPRPFRRGDPWRCELVIAAVDDATVNATVRRWAHHLGAVVNVVDDPTRCDVIMPAVLKRGPVRIAISTDAASPAGARFLREQLDEILPSGLGALYEHSASARRTLRHSGRYRYDYAAWRQRFFQPGWEALRAGELDALPELERRLVAGFDSPTPLHAGRVTLVGGGPGGADLITVRGAAALHHADVVVYDRLIDPLLLDLAPVAAERIPVGKAKGHGITQEEINRILIERAAAGANVVRLKGGDPFLFGRGGEEFAALTAAGIGVEVVPGLSSALAAPALAHIPVTHRGLASAVTIVTGHLAQQDQAQWDGLASAPGTIVVLMGASTAPAIAARLLAAGRDEHEPVAAIHRVGHADSRTATITLAALAQTGCPFSSPTVLVIGPVATALQPSAPFRPDIAATP